MTDPGATIAPSAALTSIESMALANLAAKASQGATLSDADWQRFESLQRKIEGGDPTSPLTPLLVELRACQASGKAIPKRLERLAREAWLADMSAHLWPDLAAAAPEIAAELGGVSPQTVKNRLTEWGIPFARQAISRSQVWLALARHYRAEVQAAATTQRAAPTDQVGDEIKRMRLLERTSALQQAAHDAAMQALQRLIARIRPQLVRDAAARAADRIAAPDRIEAERIIGEEIAAALTAARAAIATEPAPTTH
jgi:hypothetical protein